jgi:hypothetical protein
MLDELSGVSRVEMSLELLTAEFTVFGIYPVAGDSTGLKSELVSVLSISRLLMLYSLLLALKHTKNSRILNPLCSYPPL